MWARNSTPKNLAAPTIVSNGFQSLFGNTAQETAQETLITQQPSPATATVVSHWKIKEGDNDGSISLGMAKRLAAHSEAAAIAV